MEWEQIAERWAAMAHRLRSDGVQRAGPPGPLQDAISAPGSGHKRGEPPQTEPHNRTAENMASQLSEQ
jgi:hypothetical protein